MRQRSRSLDLTILLEPFVFLSGPPGIGRTCGGPHRLKVKLCLGFAASTRGLAGPSWRGSLADPRAPQSVPAGNFRKSGERFLGWAPGETFEVISLLAPVLSNSCRGPGIGETFGANRFACRVGRDVRRAKHSKLSLCLLHYCHAPLLGPCFP